MGCSMAIALGGEGNSGHTRHSIAGYIRGEEGLCYLHPLQLCKTGGGMALRLGNHLSLVLENRLCIDWCQPPINGYAVTCVAHFTTLATENIGFALAKQSNNLAVWHATRYMVGSVVDEAGMALTRDWHGGEYYPEAVSTELLSCYICFSVPSRPRTSWIFLLWQKEA